jgi:hypothetical protein
VFSPNSPAAGQGGFLEVALILFSMKVYNLLSVIKQLCCNASAAALGKESAPKREAEPDWLQELKKFYRSACFLMCKLGYVSYSESTIQERKAKSKR